MEKVPLSGVFSQLTKEKMKELNFLTMEAPFAPKFHQGVRTKVFEELQSHFTRIDAETDSHPKEKIDLSSMDNRIESIVPNQPISAVELKDSPLEDLKETCLDSEESKLDAFGSSREPSSDSQVKNAIGDSGPSQKELFKETMLHFVDFQAFSEFLVQVRPKTKLNIVSQKMSLQDIDLESISLVYGLSAEVSKLVEQVCRYSEEIELANDLIDRAILYGFLKEEELFKGEDRMKDLEEAHKPKYMKKINRTLFGSLVKRSILLGIDFISTVFTVAEAVNLAAVGAAGMMFFGLLGGEAMVMYSGVLAAVPKMVKKLKKPSLNPPSSFLLASWLSFTLHS